VAEVIVEQHVGPTRLPPRAHARPLSAPPRTARTSFEVAIVRAAAENVLTPLEAAGWLRRGAYKGRPSGRAYADRHNRSLAPLVERPATPA